MAWKTVLAIATALLMTPHPAAADPAPLTVRTYNNFGVVPDDLRIARGVAEDILREAGIEVVWVDCWFRRAEPANASPACRQPLGSADVVLRLQAGNANDHGKIVSMGFSLIGAGPDRPYLSTVFPDVVLSVSRGAAVDARQVLGFAIAHEIGHLMLNTNQHASSGLMRAGWSRNELRKNARADWRFLEDESVVIRSAMAAR